MATMKVTMGLLVNIARRSLEAAEIWSRDLRTAAIERDICLLHFMQQCIFLMEDNFGKSDHY